MRFALRTLVPICAAAVVVTTTTTFLSRTVVAQDAAKKSDAAPAKDASPAAAAPPTDSTAAAPATEGADPKPLLEKGEAALKAGDYAAAMTAFNDAGKASQQASQAGGGPESLKAQIAAFVGRGRAEIGLKDYDAAEKDFRNVLQSYDTN